MNNKMRRSLHFTIFTHTNPPSFAFSAPPFTLLNVTCRKAIITPYHLKLLIMSINLTPSLLKQVNAGKKMPCDRKLELFQQFWDTRNFDQQSYVLAIHMDIMDVKERTTDNGESRRGKTIKYYLRDGNGVKFECCLSTFKDVFSVSPGRIKTISGKLSIGKIDLRDQRGKTASIHTRSVLN
jgi:hypothetical protein